MDGSSPKNDRLLTKCGDEAVPAPFLNAPRAASGADESNAEKRTTLRGANPVEQTALIIGVALLLLVSVCAFLLGRRAARNIEQFREEHHESFVGKEKP